MTKDVITTGANPKLDSMVLEMLSICGMLPEPKVLIRREKAKMTTEPLHLQALFHV
ncbi:MAG: hypothetical protein ACJ0E8_01910 [Gammaproteobacteria bacterium]